LGTVLFQTEDLAVRHFVSLHFNVLSI